MATVEDYLKGQAASPWLQGNKPYLACTELPGEDGVWLLCRNVDRTQYGAVVEVLGSVPKDGVERRAGKAYVPRYEPALPGTLVDVEHLCQWVPDVLIESDGGSPWMTAQEASQLEPCEAPAPPTPPAAPRRAWGETLALLGVQGVFVVGVAVGPVVREWLWAMMR